MVAQLNHHYIFPKLLLYHSNPQITRTELETALPEWGVEVPEEIEMLFTISDTCNFTHFNKWVVKFTNKLGVGYFRTIQVQAIHGLTIFLNFDQF